MSAVPKRLANGNAGARAQRPLWLKGRARTEARREIAAIRPGEVWSTDHPITFEEFNDLTPEDTYAELFEGVIYMPQPNDEHEEAFRFLFLLLGTYADAKDAGPVRGSRSGILLDDFSAPQPDLLFVRKERRHIITRQAIIEPPDLVMEIVSSDSGRHRAVTRMLRYEQFGVPEYWYIDLPLRQLKLNHLDRDGHYKVTAQNGRGVIASKVLPGFALRAKWLWSEPGKFPSVYSIVQELVAGRVPR